MLKPKEFLPGDRVAYRQSSNQQLVWGDVTSREKYALKSDPSVIPDEHPVFATWSFIPGWMPYDRICDWELVPRGPCGACNEMMVKRDDYLCRTCRAEIE